MFDPTDPETFWLNATNIALGAVTLICIIAVASVVFREVLARVRARVVEVLPSDDHAFAHPELGLTMADGGERLDKPAGRNAVADDPKNIQRSDN